MTARGISLHIGLNAIDPTHYGTSGQLAGCENDARQMQRVATVRGFQPRVLLTRDATSANVIAAITDAARRLKTDDIFLLTYAGHGSQVPDTNGDESDGMDETWCLYDRMLVDDELYGLWSLFAPGVRVCMVSDSCHSGTVARAYATSTVGPTGARNGNGRASKPRRYRALPLDDAIRTYDINRDLYDRIQRDNPVVPNAIGCSVLLLAACQDNQTAADGDRDGAFTTGLLSTWNNGKYARGYADFVKDIAVTLGSSQVPNLDRAGTRSPAFEQQSPFTITLTGATTMPSSAIIDTHIEHPTSDFLTIDDRLARIKAAVGTRDLQPPPTSIDDGPHFVFNLTVPRSALTNADDSEVYKFLQGDGCDVLMRSYLQVSSIPVPRDFDGHLGCSADSHGNWECHGEVSIHF